MRALCEFTAKAGDLDLRFTPSPTAQEGIAGHATVAARRAAGYEKEVPLEGRYGMLHVRGRADGYDPAQQRLEEVKTFRGAFERIPENHRALHWAQLKIYGHLLCQSRGLTQVHLRLVYFAIDTQRETALDATHDAATLAQFFATQCARFLRWAEQEVAHRAARDAALAALPFPHEVFRPGQRDLAESVYRAAVSGRCLMAQAPTGIGKSIGVLYPMLKACPGQKIDKVFFLSAKTPGRQIALDAAAQLCARPVVREGAQATSTQPASQTSQTVWQAGTGPSAARRQSPAELSGSAPLRVLELVARDKACEHPDKACHGESCPLAKGFYDRLPAARDAAVASADALTQATLRRIALAHGVCPYYLAQDLVRWSDLVVGDYHYWFDLHALLHALTVENDWRVGVLVDEAHNLIARGRGMYSATLDQAALQQARRVAPPAVRRALDRVQRHWRALHAEHEGAYQVLDSPDEFLAVLQPAVAAMAEALEQANEMQFNDVQANTSVAPGLSERAPATLFDTPPDARAQSLALSEFYLEALHFTRIGERFGAHSLFDVSLRTDRGDRRHRPLSSLCLRNVVPATFLAPRFASAHSVTLFSATLAPWQYTADMLGLPDDAPFIDVASPFRAEQLDVRIATGLSTRYRDRAASLTRLADTIATQVRERPGNYLAFFSSFAYLEQAVACVQTRHPDIPLRCQRRGMSEPERRDFLAGFSDAGNGVAFAVLGGAFGEGIDLPGTQLIGAFIATLGMPQVDAVNEAMRERIAALFGDGFAYMYLYPGLQKVVQAAGRVIRTPTDEGVLHLLDERFAQPEIRALLPEWWGWAPEAG